MENAKIVSRCRKIVCAMSSGEQTFRLTEATRLIKATVAAGLTVKRITIDANGRPVVITDKDEAAEQKKPPS